MTYEKFLDCLEQELHDLMKNGEEIRRVEVLKNNSVRLDGFFYRMPYRKGRTDCICESLLSEKYGYDRYPGDCH